MSPGPEQPDLFVEEAPASVRTIVAVDSSIALFAGWAPRGLAAIPVRIQSWDDYDREFGGLDARSGLSFSVSHFFANGGREAFVVRIVDTGSSAPAATATAFIDGYTVSATSPGAWGNGLRIDSSAISAGRRWDLYLSGPAGDETLVETFEGSVDDPSSPSWLAALTERSRWIRAAASTDSGSSEFAGGADGAVIGPDDDDFRRAVLALFDEGGPVEAIDLVNLVCIPGLSDRETLAALLPKVAALGAFLVMDCPPDATLASVATSIPAGPDLDSGALYFPWVTALDPLTGTRRAFPPSGFICGLYARIDSTRGVWKAPAGTAAHLAGASGLTVAVSDNENGPLNARAVNCLRRLPAGIVCWGARTLAGADSNASDWKYVPVRRLALMIEQSLCRGLQWAVFETSDDSLWAAIRLNAGAFLGALFRQGAFQGQTQRESYFVKCDRDTNPAADIAAGFVTVVVGFAPLKPAEFITVTIRLRAGQSPP